MNVRAFFTLLGGLVLPLAGLPAADAATKLYRYQDDQGVVAIGATVPPEFVKNGYEVISPTGRVIEVVPRALTPEEIAAREAAAAEERRKAEEARRKREEDALLLRLYGRPEEAIKARDRRLQELDGVISLKRGNIQALITQIEDLQSKAAQIERSGKEVPEELLERMGRLRAGIQDIEQEITQSLAEKQSVEEDFAVKIERLRYLQEMAAGKAGKVQAKSE